MGGVSLIQTTLVQVAELDPGFQTGAPDPGQGRTGIWLLSGESSVRAGGPHAQQEPCGPPVSSTPAVSGSPAGVWAAPLPQLLQEAQLAWQDTSPLTRLGVISHSGDWHCALGWLSLLDECGPAAGHCAVCTLPTPEGQGPTCLQLTATSGAGGGLCPGPRREPAPGGEQLADRAGGGHELLTTYLGFSRALLSLFTHLKPVKSKSPWKIQVAGVPVCTLGSP